MRVPEVFILVCHQLWWLCSRTGRSLSVPSYRSLRMSTIHHWYTMIVLVAWEPALARQLHVGLKWGLSVQFLSLPGSRSFEFKRIVTKEACCPGLFHSLRASQKGATKRGTSRCWWAFQLTRLTSLQDLTWLTISLEFASFIDSEVSASS